MIVYKKVDFFSQKTGEKLGTKKQADFHICDFTGERIGEHENPNTYQVDYRDNDPCFGDSEGEEWLYKLKFKVFELGIDGNDEEDYNNLFNQSEYVFKEVGGIEVFGELLKAAKKAKIEICSLDHLLRWSRGKMLEKVIKDGTYTLDDFSAE